jgi:hypothetical protein
MKPYVISTGIESVSHPKCGYSIAAFSRHLSRCYPLSNHLRPFPAPADTAQGKMQGKANVQVGTMRIRKLSCCQNVIAHLF